MPRIVGRRSLELKRDIALKRIDECLSAGVEAKNDSNRVPIFLSRYSKLESYCTSFETHHLKLCSEITDSEELDKEDDIRQDFDHKYFEIIEIHSLLSPLCAQSNTSNECNNTNLGVKLPRLNLLNFDGDLKSWGTFYDMYNTMVHQNRKLSNIERFSILISLLRGEPLQLLKGFPLSENNYLDAYAALIDRYQCKRKIAFRHWEEIQNVKFTSNSPRELRRIVDTFKENLAVLKNLKLPIWDWDFPLFYLLINKLDRDTRRRFELQNETKSIPSFESLLEFLDKAGQALELAEPNEPEAVATAMPRAPRPPRQATATTRTSPAFSPRSHALVANNSSYEIICPKCKSNHAISNCSTYRNLSPRDRFTVVKESGLCVNCLRSGHVVRSCPSKSRCYKCNMPHHTSLHFDSAASSTTEKKISHSSTGTSSTISFVATDVPVSGHAALSPSSDHSLSPTVTLVSGQTPTSHLSLLATALVEVVDNFGEPRKIRIVVDSGSQSNFITKKCARRLGLPLQKTTMSVEGIGQSSSVVTNATTFRMRGVEPNFVIDVEAFTIPKVCSKLPSCKIDTSRWSELKSIHLADPGFNLPGPVDALIGVDLFCHIFIGERFDCGNDGPVAFNTKLGWIIMGRVNDTLSSALSSYRSRQSSLLCTLESLDSQIRKFWEVDDLPRDRVLSEDDALSEKIFVETHTRDTNGRYTVRLPFKDSKPSFGDSLIIARQRLLSLEKRLAKDPQLRRDYNLFMKEYIDAGHMDPITGPQSDRTYYIPHHCVLKPSSTTTKLRVVFDATAKPPNGPALNEQLLVGPKLQMDIGSILLNFRLHEVVFTADIKQMYRQILVSPLDRDCQRILFRFSQDDPIQEFRLNTVTYGMASSSYLALRTIMQLADDEAREHPLAATALKTYVYVDDVVTGSDTFEHARELQAQIIDTLKSGCFELRKWASNSPLLLENVPPEHRLDKSLSFSDTDSPIKVLGLEWKPSSDSFSFSVSPRHEHCTKRNVLSEVARIFDPLGYLTPFTFAFKHIIQRLWSLNLDWDDPAPDDIARLWSRYRLDLPMLSRLEIPRFIPVMQATRLELHGFSDASEIGYAAVVYFRIERATPECLSSTHLITARSKVNPLKKISIPRSELCAAVLLSNLVEYVKSVYADKIHIDAIFCWSDSTVVLSWLRSPSSRWKTYVSNRVAHIQERVPPSHWRHVRSEYNPADCASRGLTGKNLLGHSLWWFGPEWLKGDEETWPVSVSIEDTSSIYAEQRKSEISLFIETDRLDNFLDKYSSLRKIQRIVAFIRRFVYNCRHPNNHKTGHLVASELNESMLTLVKLTQSQSFSSEIADLKKGSPLPKSLRKLNPFIDENGLLRVGGRLTHSDLDYDCKHPILLSRHHRFTYLIIDQTHNDNHHPGLRTLSFLLAQNYWILSSRRAISSRLSKCIKCFRTNPIPLAPRMADLPKFRVSQAKPFSCVGVDFAGPFHTHILRYRGSRTFKSYVCLFVCLATKAVHIELVLGLTSDAFIGALRRFIARRGRCQRIVCDRGTNFVGAYNALFPLMQQAAATDAIEFSFNPPAASHFGGIWEINVKSFKTHLARVVGNQILTHEEFFTLTTQIEALLNSRPLCEMGSDPNDMSVLTPGHFLTLEPLTSLPAPQPNLSCSNRWKLLQKMHNDFWKRWSLEYLHTLNQRAKWHTNSIEPKIGSLILLKDEQLKPLNWSLGRIIQLHPGRDGIARVATIKTQAGQLQRPLVKLCPLPLDN